MTGIYRDNLAFSVQALSITRTTSSAALVAPGSPTKRGAVIVYASTIARGRGRLRSADVNALPEGDASVARYHGRLPAKERKAQQEAFMRGDRARDGRDERVRPRHRPRPTCALVLHDQMPGGLDAYYQEAGRAGRDGQPARCVLFWLQKDKAIQSFFLAGRYPTLSRRAGGACEADRDAARRWRRGRSTTLRARRSIGRSSKVQVALALLRQERLVQQRRDGTLDVVVREVDDPTIERLVKRYGDKRDHDRAALEQMVFYGQTGQCRWHVLLAHFDEDIAFDRCGHCDNCRRMGQVEAREQRRDAAEVPDDEGPALRVANPPRVAPPPAAFDAGTPVVVKRYGRGVVDHADAEHVTVEFPNGEKRCFLAAFVSRRRRGARAIEAS